MKGRLLMLNAAVALALLPGPVRAGTSQMQDPAPEPQGVTKFRSSIDVVSVSAVVRDRKGRFVGNLEKQDFIVAEDGQPRTILDFHAQTDGPVKLALLFDISGSMRVGSKAVDARQAALHLFSALRPTDEAAVFTFDTRLQRVSAFTSDVSVLDAALDHVEPPYGQTSLYDAAAETARAISSDGPGHAVIPQRSAVVIITDGIDTRSRLTAEQVTAVASGIDIPVYIIAVMSTIDDPRQSGMARTAAAGALENLARWTGGELFTASAPAHASVAARQIVDELRHQYRLAFEASTRPGWRPLEVRARDRDLTVRARAGYTVGTTDGVLNVVAR
ncbi:MAG: VWA domain-containing protein [Acidobacteriota bacterium]